MTAIFGAMLVEVQLSGRECYDLQMQMKHRETVEITAIYVLHDKAN
jgi:hypothetical protein